MKSIAVVGAGSIGLYYGGKLAASGCDVRFLLRSGYDEARREGIRITSPDKNIHLTHPQIFKTPNEIGTVDLVIVSLKATANASLPSLIPPLLGEDTMILTLQNGLGNEEFLASHFGAGRILGALCFVCLTRQTPASVNHVGHGRLSLGEFGRLPLPRTRVVYEAFLHSGIDARLVENLAEERWRKLVWNVPFNGLAVAAGGITVDRILADPSLHAECRGLMEEIITVANALGYPIEATYADYQIDRTYPMGPYQPSTLIDFQQGYPLEIEPIWGEPLRKARAAGVSTPLLASLYERLLEANPGA